MPDQVMWQHVNLTYTDADGNVTGNEILGRGAYVPDEGLDPVTRDQLRIIGAIRLVDVGLPVAVTDARAMASAPLPEPEEVLEPAPPPPPDLTGVGGQSPAKPKAAEPARGDDGPPPQSEPKAAWVDYAVSKRPAGQSETDAREKAEAMSKEQLVGRYGGKQR